MGEVRNTLWMLAVLSLSLGASAAVTKPAPAAKSKTPAKTAAKPVARTAAKTSSKTPGKAAATPVKTANAASYRGRPAVQPQYNRYGSPAARRGAANSRTAVVRQQRPVYRPAPMVPSADRTREIQSALAQKGPISMANLPEPGILIL